MFPVRSSDVSIKGFISIVIYVRVLNFFNDLGVYFLEGSVIKF